MTMMSLAERLARIPRLSGLSPDDLAKLAAITTLEVAPAGAVLFREGDPSDRFWLVDTGRVALTLKPSGRQETTLLTLGPGDLLGWSALLGTGRRVAQGRVTQDCTLLRLDREPVLALCEADHDVGYALMRLAFEEVSERLLHARLQLLDLYGRTGP